MSRTEAVREVPPAARRALRIYAMDPLVMGLSDNCVVAQVPFEPLKPGPVGRRIEVIDWDPQVGRFYSPVNLDHPHVLAQDGLPPSESDPRFHQQMVYAVISTTLERFELALGRPVGWGPGRPRLRVYPHGCREVNAYFDAGRGALVFGYFRAGTARPGRNLPGGVVFTCLSHDVIAHETAHALVHGLRRRFMEPTNPDTPAFHEAFADLVSILQHLSLPGVVENAIQVTRASLNDATPLTGIGRQLSDALGARGSLRGALGEPPDPRARERSLEPHERGSVLVAAVFDAMTAVYRSRTRDLLRIATGGTGELPPGLVPPELVHRLAGEARRTAGHFLNICIRALDYCPPVDIEFGEFLRAMVTADRELEPEDKHGYRMAIVEAFRARGIYPNFAFSLAEDSVVWDAFEGKPDLGGIDFRQIHFAGHEVDRGPRIPYRALLQELVNRPRNKRLFHLERQAPAEVTAVHPLRRIGPDRRIHDELVVEVLQTHGKLVPYPGAPPFRSGATIILSRSGEVRWVIYKKFGASARRERQREYLSSLASLDPAAAYQRPMMGLSFARIHRGL